jgi:hypothetical protein
MHNLRITQFALLLGILMLHLDKLLLPWRSYSCGMKVQPGDKGLSMRAIQPHHTCA